MSMIISAFQQFIMGEEKMTSHMLLILDGASLQKLFERLGIANM